MAMRSELAVTALKFDPSSLSRVRCQTASPSDTARTMALNESQRDASRAGIRNALKSSIGLRWTASEAGARTTVGRYPLRAQP
jgi:hypothetical protein